MSLAQAVFAAGCFWGVQASFNEVPGVQSTTVGYIGGHTENPGYEDVCRDDTGHAEAIRITYNDQEVSYDDLLDVFFAIHDPTTLNRQGPDIGSQYRSAIFYLTPQQKEAALHKIAALNKSGIYKNPIVTEVIPATAFYPAETYHQDYLAKQGRSGCSLQRPLISLSNEEWQEKLTPEQYRVLRQKGTERPFSGLYLEIKDNGTFACAACGNKIFESSAKFDSGSGWPSFDKAIPGSVKLIPDFSHGMNRTEVICAHCGSHLGHVFADGPTDTGMRFCINSAAMEFKKQ